MQPALHLLACQVTVIVGDSGLSCCVSCYHCDVCRALLLPFVLLLFFNCKKKKKKKKWQPSLQLSSDDRGKCFTIVPPEGKIRSLLPVCCRLSACLFIWEGGGGGYSVLFISQYFVLCLFTAM